MYGARTQSARVLSVRRTHINSESLRAKHMDRESFPKSFNYVHVCAYVCVRMCV